MLEKESRIRELLLITGLKQWVLWTSWYIKQLVFLLGLAIVLSVMLKVLYNIEFCEKFSTAQNISHLLLSVYIRYISDCVQNVCRYVISHLYT